MRKIALIGGTGLAALGELEIEFEQQISTPYGPPSAPIMVGELNNTTLMFLPRHGTGHTIPPHRINYRANIWALHSLGVSEIIAVNAVGGIRADTPPSALIVPDQLIDYSWGREGTFYDGLTEIQLQTGLGAVDHIDFTTPYSKPLRQRLLRAGRNVAGGVVADGTYGVTQGPRLESAAEIRRMEQDGCAIVGMTALPEAALARELGIDYATLAVVANWAAGKADTPLTMEVIEHNLTTGMQRVMALLTQLLQDVVPPE